MHYICKDKETVLLMELWWYISLCCASRQCIHSFLIIILNARSLAILEVCAVTSLGFLLTHCLSLVPAVLPLNWPVVVLAFLPSDLAAFPLAMTLKVLVTYEACHDKESI